MDSERNDQLDSGVGSQKTDKYELHEKGTNDDMMASNIEKQKTYMGESLIKGEKTNNKKRKKLKNSRGRPVIVNEVALESSTTKQILNAFSKDEERVEEEKGTTAILPSQYIDKKKEKGILKRPPFRSSEKAPSLVFFSHGNGGKTHTICSMRDRKIYVRSIPQLARKKCGVCPLGWILGEDWDTKHFTLLNPVSMELIDLPPIPQLPKLHPYVDRYRGDWSFQMTAPPTDKSSIIILYYSHVPYIIFCYPQEKVWYVRRCRIGHDDDCQGKKGGLRKDKLREGDDPLVSIAVVDGNIYGYTFAGKYTMLIFNHCNFTIKCLDVQMPEDELYSERARASYLVHSCGNMYMVNTFDEGFFVFKMNFIEMRWEEAENIGDNKAFLIDFKSEGVSFHADEACLQRNCIYYVSGDNYLHEYNLEDKSITMLSYFPRLRLPDNVSPHWILPQSKDLTNLDDSKLNFDIPPSLQECLGPEKNLTRYYKTSNIEKGFTTPSKQPIQETRDSVIAARSMTKGGGDIWLSLLPELVLDIVKHLSYLDSRCALLAIPQWGPVIRTIAKPIGTWYQDSPCFLSFSDDYKSCTLMDPVRNVRHLIQSPGLRSNLLIVYAKHGWLLLRGPTCDDVFFYNPLSKAVINLPQPPEIFPWCLSFSFSAPPTSPDCVVVAYYLYPNSKKILVCSRGENSWTQVLHEWEQGEVLMVQVTSAVFVKEKFYWLSRNGMLGVLDPTTRSWGINRTYKFEKLPDTYQYYLMESDDELFRVWAGKMGESVRVDKLDCSSFTWHEVTSLKGRCFFLTQKASISTKASVFKDKEERIYFPMLHDDQLVCYSYQTHKMLPSNNFYGAKEFLYSCWIQPSWVQPTSEELKWF